MITKTVTVREGEWLGDVPDDWDFEAFFNKHIAGGMCCSPERKKERLDRVVAMFKQMAQALKDGKEVWATQSGDFTHRVLSCGLYDGWVFWEPRPCYLYSGTLGAEKDEFYNLTAIKIK